MASLRHRRRSGHERGAALVEFALSLPLLLVVIAGIVDFAFLFQRYEVVTNAAREGARLGATPAYSAQFDVLRAHVQAYVREGLGMTQAAIDANMPIPASVQVSQVVKSYTVGSPAATHTVPAIRVTATYQHQFLLLGPMLNLIGGTWGSGFTIRSTSEMRLEAPGTGGGS